MKTHYSIEPRNKQTIKGRLLKTTVAASILGLVIVLLFVFNIGNIRHAFASPGTVYYSANNGEWDSVGTWSTIGYGGAISANYPKAGDVVNISGFKIRVSKADAACGNITVTNGGSGIYISNGHLLNSSGSLAMNANSGNGTMDFSVTGNNSAASIATDFTNSMSGGNIQLNITTTNNAVITAGYNFWLTYTSGGGCINMSLKNSSQLSTATVNYTSSVANKAIITMNNTSSLYLRGNITRKDSKMLYGSLKSYDSSLVYLKGSAQQQINVAQGGDTMFIAKMLIRNTNATVPQVTLFGNINITNNLIITSGVVKTTSTGMFVIESGATVTTGSTSCYISGPMRKDGNSAFLFPIGKNGTYAPLGISAPTLSSSFVAEYFNSGATNTSSKDTGLATVSNLEYWDIERPSGNGAAAVTLYWYNATGSKITSPTQLRVSEYNSSTHKWQSWGIASYTASGTTGSITSQAMSSFAPITFGSHTTVNALPVSLLSFEADRQGDAVELKWATASETNNNYFNIERSQDGTLFSDIGKIDGHGNSTEILNYAFTDPNPLIGTSYYRLRQTDYNGHSETFEMKAITITGDVTALAPPSPNPFTDHFNLEYSLAQETDITLQIVNLNGSILSEEKLHGNRGKNEYRFVNGATLRNGQYILRLGNGAGVMSEKIVKVI